MNDLCFWRYNYFHLLVTGISGRTPLEFLPSHPQENLVWQVPSLPTGWQMRESPLGATKSSAQVHSSGTTEPHPWTLNTSALHHRTTLPFIVQGCYYRYRLPFGRGARISFLCIAYPYKSRAFVCRTVEAFSGHTKVLRTYWSNIVYISLWKPFTEERVSGREAVGILKSRQGRRPSW